MEQTILDTIYLFNLEAQALRNRVPGLSIEFTLAYEHNRYGDDPATKLLVAVTGTNYEAVKGASLRAVMDEIYRRLGFDDKQALAMDAINASLRALPPPTEPAVE